MCSSAAVTAAVHVAQRHASPARTTAPRREQSPLNPNSQALRAAGQASGSSAAAADGVRTHIANLDRVLGNPPTVPRPTGSHAHAASKEPQAGSRDQEPLNVRHGLLNALDLSFFVPMPGMRARTAADEHMSPRRGSFPTSPGRYPRWPHRSRHQPRAAPPLPLQGRKV